MVFKKIPDTMSAAQRLGNVEKFMSENFKGVRIRDCGNFYTGSFPNNRKSSPVSYVEFH